MTKTTATTRRSSQLSPMRILTGVFVVNLDRKFEMMTPIVSQVAPSSSSSICLSRFVSVRLRSFIVQHRVGVLHRVILAAVIVEHRGSGQHRRSKTADKLLPVLLFKIKGQMFLIDK